VRLSAVFVSVLSVACVYRAPDIEYAPTGLRGPRVVSVTGQSEDVGELELRLSRLGFRLAAPDDPEVQVRIAVDGVCGFSGVTDPTLNVEGIERATKQRVFLAVVRGPSSCPGPFFDEVAAALNRLWAP
jgi:hypothetical protein